VFNMGIGMVTVVAARFADSIRDQLADHGVESWVIGGVRAATGAGERVRFA